MDRVLRDGVGHLPAARRMFMHFPVLQSSYRRLAGKGYWWRGNRLGMAYRSGAGLPLSC